MPKTTSTSLPVSFDGDIPATSCVAPVLIAGLRVKRYQCGRCEKSVVATYNTLSPCPHCKSPTRWMPLYDAVERADDPVQPPASASPATALEPAGGETNSGCVVCGQPAPDGPLCTSCNEQDAGMPVGEGDRPAAVADGQANPPLSAQANDALDLLYGRFERHSQGAIKTPSFPEEKFDDAGMPELTRRGLVERRAYNLVITTAGRAYVEATLRKLDEAAALFDTKDGVPAYMQPDVPVAGVRMTDDEVIPLMPPTLGAIKGRSEPAVVDVPPSIAERLAPVDPAVVQAKLVDLPTRQREFLLDLVTGHSVIKNAATRIALVNRKLIESHVGPSREWWANIHMTPLGEAVAAKLLEGQAMPPAPDATRLSPPPVEPDHTSAILSAEPVISLDIDGKLMHVSASGMEQALRDLAETVTTLRATNAVLRRDNRQLQTELSMLKRGGDKPQHTIDRETIDKLRSDMEDLRADKDTQIAALQAQIAEMKARESL